MKMFPLISFLIVSTLSLHAQQFDTLVVSSDIRSAMVLPFPTKCCFILPKPAAGPGEVHDYINTGRKNSMLLSAEKHSSWHYVVIPYDGLLYMDLIPLDSLNDYDFAFFRANRGEDVSQAVARGQLLPEISCISRNDPGNGGITGMRDGTEASFVNIGPGRQFIKPLEVLKGEKWLLYIDNNANHGQGFKLKFQMKKMLSIQGVVEDDEGKHVKSDVSVMNNQTGIEIHKTQTDDSGAFRLNIPMAISEKYTVLFSGKDHFFTSQSISPQDLVKGGEVKVKPVLPVLKEGKIIPVNNINFFGNMAIIIPQSKPVMRRLLELMRDQQDLHIRICGHVNGCERGKDYNQKLSDARALSVYSFLKEQGIDANRMEMRGYGCTKMIYPTPKNEFENEQNRRVEIEILKVR